MPRNGKSLKALNLPLLVAALVADGAIVALVAGVIDAAWLPEANLKRVSSVMILSIVALLLVNLFPQSWRDRIANLRWSHALPGHRAFTEYGPTDKRVDMVSVERKFGKLPTGPDEQNRIWYKLYKEVGSEISVAQSHGRYLLFRDLAAMSLVLFLFSPTLAFVFDWHLVMWAALLFGFQTLLCALVSRNLGIRFVTNVLALQGTALMQKHKPNPIRTSGLT